jgi:hypothetical protein
MARNKVQQSKKLKNSKLKAKTPIDLKTWDYKNFAKNELRRSFRQSPLYNAAKNAAKEEYFVESQKGSLMRRVHWRCASCGRFFKDEKGNLAVDHIEPIEPVDREIGFDEYVDRLYCGLDGLQVLCNYKKEIDGVKSCHKIKTTAENNARKVWKKQQRGG